MCGKIVPNWIWEYTIYCVNYLLILIHFILVITVITAITAITVIMAINARMANTLFPDVRTGVFRIEHVIFSIFSSCFDLGEVGDETRCNT